MWSLERGGGEGEWPVRPTLVGSVDYRVYPAEEEGLTGFALSRLRPGLMLAPVEWFYGQAAVEFAGKNPMILDAYGRLIPVLWLDIRFGYSRPRLFASFSNEPVTAMVFSDRAPVVSSFRIRRDLGVDARVRPRSLPLEGWIRIGNGTGSAVGNDNALPAGYAGVDVVLGRAHVVREGAAQERMGLRVGVAGLYERAEDRQGIAGDTPLGFRYYRPAIVSGTRVVGEAHLVGYAGRFRLSVESAWAYEERSRDGDGNPDTPPVPMASITSYGVSAELVWTIMGALRQVGRAPEGGAGGALEVAARYDGMWLGRGAEDVNPGGSQGGGVVMKWWPARFLSTSVTGYLTRYEVAAIERPAELWSWGLVAGGSFFWM